MNILLSYNWLKEHIATKKSPQELEKILSLHSMSVERILPEVELLTDRIVLGEIVEVKKHPNADKLKLAVVSDGKAKFDVVCGAPNIKKGMKIAFAGIGAMVKWHGEGDPVELLPAEIRGQQSFGMICDDSEIGLAKDPNPEGVTDYSHLKAKVGTPLVKALGLDDIVLDVEITTNRIDAASVVGMARELSAITGEKLKELKLSDPAKGAGKSLEVVIDDKKKCLGFNAIVLDNVKVGPSPEWMQRRLRASGHSVFNNVVDITNYVMMEMGHPLHSFDYDKVKDGHIIIRAAKNKEKLMALDDEEMELTDKMVVVADKDQALSLGGVIGGKSSMITDGTKTVLLEAASWNPQTIRNTMQKLDKFSDAGGYFNKGVSPELSQDAIKRAIELLVELAGAKVAGPLLSKGYQPYKPKQVAMRLSAAEKIIGASLDPSKVKKQLEALGFSVKAKGKDEIVCTVPHWRQFDVAIEEDLIEEVARLYGYENVENRLPSGEMARPEFDKHLEYEDRLKTLMKGFGYTELYTYSMVSEDLLKVSDRYVKDAIRLLNPLDDDHVVMRTAILPGMIEVAAMNQGVVDKQRLFEIANIYTPVKPGKAGSGSAGKNDLPQEQSEMAGVLIGDDLDAMFREAKGVVAKIMTELGLHNEFYWEMEPMGLGKKGQTLSVTIDKKALGYVAVLNHNVASKLGLKTPAIVFRLDLHDLIELAKHHLVYTPLSKYPAVALDLSITVDNNVSWGQVEEVVEQAGGELLRSIDLFDVYDHGNGKKSFAFHLEYRDDEKTLEMKAVDKLQKQIVEKLGTDLGAKLR